MQNNIPILSQYLNRWLDCECHGRQIGSPHRDVDLGPPHYKQCVPATQLHLVRMIKWELVTLGIWSNKTSTFYCTGYILYQRFKIIFSMCFFLDCFLDLIAAKKLLVFKFFTFHETTQYEMPTMLQNKKLQLRTEM